MTSGSARILAALALVVTALALVASSSGHLPLASRGGPLRPSAPQDDRPNSGRSGGRSGCVRDPAGLPPPPPGPDGRPSNYLHTCGSRIYDSQGREARIAGLNWSGMESSTYAPHGLSERNWREVLDQIAALGYNTVRLPFSTEALEPGRKVSGISFGLNPDLEGLTGLEMLDLLIAGARERGLKVILDRHFVSAGRLTTLWYTPDVPEERWIADWRMLAARYRGNDTVIAVDLHNEPHGEATWGTGDPATDWRLAAERAGSAVLEVNPYVLVFVEGVEHHEGDAFWWGGNLLGARTAPVRLPVPNRLVYSPHDYGPAISEQPWFWDADYPRNLPGEWDRHWGYIHREGIAPVVVGEFGGRSVGDDRDGQWQRALIDYLRANDVGALIWSLNPSWDTGGILAGDWRTVERARNDAYRQLLAAPLDVGLRGVFGLAPTRFRVQLRPGETDETSHTVAFSFRIVNEGPDAPRLGDLELRYWLGEGTPDDATRPVSVETADLDGRHVRVDLVAADRGDQSHYLRVRFDERAGAIAPYRTSGVVTVRFARDRRLTHSQRQDHSYGAPPEPQRFVDWRRVTLYRDGELVWGVEP